MTHVAQEIIARYESRLSRSHAMDAAAKNYLPGGDTRSTTYILPYPAYMVRGEGCCLYDEDGNRYIDFLNNYTSLIHGHGNPAVLAAAEAQMRRGTVFGAPAMAQYELAEIICERVPGI